MEVSQPAATHPRPSSSAMIGAITIGVVYNCYIDYGGEPTRSDSPAAIIIWAPAIPGTCRRSSAPSVRSARSQRDDAQVECRTSKSRLTQDDLQERDGVQAEWAGLHHLFGAAVAAPARTRHGRVHSSARRSAAVGHGARPKRWHVGTVGRAAPYLFGAKDIGRTCSMRITIVYVANTDYPNGNGPNHLFGAGPVRRRTAHLHSLCSNYRLPQW